MSKIIYIASERYNTICKFVSKLVAEGNVVFSPIVYGHTLLRATNELYNQKNQHLIVGHKYVIKDVIEIQDRVILDVEHLSSSKRIGLFSDRHFIPFKNSNSLGVNELIPVSLILSRIVCQVIGSFGKISVNHLSINVTR